MDSDVVDDERVERILELPLHAVASLVLLGLVLPVWALGQTPVAAFLGISAFLVSLNGASIVAWHRLNDRFEPGEAGAVPDRPTREITFPTPSAEMKTAGVMTLGLVAVFTVIRFGVDALGLSGTAYATTAALAVSNAGYVWWWHNR